MTKENNGWISVDPTKKDEIPLLKPLYIKTKNYGIYVGFLDIFPEDDIFDYIDEDGNGFIYKWDVPEISSTLPFNEVKSYIPVQEVNNVFQKTNWISVEDKLPDDGQEVLIVWHGETRIAIADLVPDGRALFSLGFYDIDGVNWTALYRYSGEIKFWQPLPLPPIK